MSLDAVLAYTAGALLTAWGAMHIAPTRQVASSFGHISVDSHRIFVMEWVAEGLTHISIGVLVILVTAVEGAGDPTAQLVFRIAAGALLALATLTAFTGSRTGVIWFKVCPFVLSGAALMLVLAGLI